MIKHSDFRESHLLQWHHITKEGMISVTRDEISARIDALYRQIDQENDSAQEDELAQKEEQTYREILRLSDRGRLYNDCPIRYAGFLYHQTRYHEAAQIALTYYPTYLQSREDEVDAAYLLYLLVSCYVKLEDYGRCEAVCRTLLGRFRACLQSPDSAIRYLYIYHFFQLSLLMQRKYLENFQACREALSLETHFLEHIKQAEGCIPFFNRMHMMIAKYYALRTRYAEARECLEAAIQRIRQIENWNEKPSLAVDLRWNYHTSISFYESICDWQELVRMARVCRALEAEHPELPPDNYSFHILYLLNNLAPEPEYSEQYARLTQEAKTNSAYPRCFLDDPKDSLCRWLYDNRDRLGRELIFPVSIPDKTWEDLRVHFAFDLDQSEVIAYLKASLPRLGILLTRHNLYINESKMDYGRVPLQIRLSEIVETEVIRPQKGREFLRIKLSWRNIDDAVFHPQQTKALIDRMVMYYREQQGDVGAVTLPRFPEEIRMAQMLIRKYGGKA